MTSKRKSSADDTVFKPASKKLRSTEKLKASMLPSYDFANLLEVSTSCDRHSPSQGRSSWQDALAPGVPLDGLASLVRSSWRSERPSGPLAVLDDTPAPFWEWEFHGPLESGSAQSNRRKPKMRA
ncbi:hypothetical protein L915_01111, partial [Phytophthora nicotianae]